MEKSFIVRDAEMFEVTDTLFAEISNFRKELHRIPETAGKEFETCAAVRKKLSEIEGVINVRPIFA